MQLHTLARCDANAIAAGRGTRLDLAFTIAGTVLLAIGLLMAAWGLRGDRSKRFGGGWRWRCPRCWYDLSGLAAAGALAGVRAGPIEATCPECGRGIARIEEMLRARRRWSAVAVGAVVIAAGIGLRSWPAIAQHGPWVVAPTWLLVRVVPMDDPAWTITDWGTYRHKVPRAGALVELVRRGTLGTWSPATRRLYASRFVASDPLVLTNLFRTRSAWLPDSPVVMHVDDEGSPTNLLALYVRTRMQGRGEEWHEFWFGPGSAWSPRRIEWPPLGPGGSAVIEGEIWTEPVGTPGSRPIWSGTVRAIRAGTPTDELMIPVAESELTERSSVFFDTTLIDLGTEGLELDLSAIGHHLGSNASPDWALGAKVEILHRGEVVAEGEMLYPMQPKGMLAQMGIRHHTFDLKWTAQPRMQRDGQPIADWRVRLTGDQLTAAKDLDRTHFWPGTVEVPIEQLMFSGDDPF